MAFDGLLTSAIVAELTEKITGSRIDKIYQPQSTTIIMRLRHKRDNLALLLSAHPVRSRVHLTTQKFDNPKSPPMFCMVLRKHLEGGKIISVSQPNLERQIIFQILNKDELGNIVLKQLVCEIMGKHSNIILLDENEKIIDGLKKYSYAVNQYRQVLPGETYKEPPSQNKFHPQEFKDETFFQNLILQGDLEEPLWKRLLNIIQGFGPETCKELIYRANLNKDITINECGEHELISIWQQINSINKILKENNFKPTLIKKDNTYKDFSALDLQQYPKENKIYSQSMSEIVDLYFTFQEEKEKYRNTSHSLQKLLKKELDRCFKKAKIQKETISKAESFQKYRLYGELLTANIYRIKRGMEKIEVENYYSETGETIEIPLQPELTPSENAQRYFKKYNKATSSAKQAEIHYKKTLDEIFYLESTFYWLQNASNLEEVLEIKNELIKSNYLKPDNKKDKKKEHKEKLSKPKPLSFLSQDGFTILVGKNNNMNDYLTLKVASSHDIWLHVKDMPGSHVIIRTERKEVPETTLYEGAILAAYYSKGKHSGNVPVDYTFKKHVRKPSGAKPGMVIYDNHKTIYVTPESEIVEKIFNRKKLKEN